jgi:aspartyl protease family protein
MTAPNNTQSIGKGMMIIAFILLLGLFSFFFQGVLEEQYNPNQKINSSVNNQLVEIQLQQNRMGHYVTSGTINGIKTVFLFDTGATYVAIPEKFARKLKLPKGRRITISTANGTSIGYQTLLSEVTLGQIKLHDIKAIITPGLNEILLGMSVLKQLEFTQRGEKMIIRQYL